MTNPSGTIWKSAITLLVAGGVLSSATLATDLSRYRQFQLGTDLPTVSKQAGVDPSDATLIHSRPALIQELAWRPRLFTAPPQTEAAKEVIFTFYNGELFRVAIEYDPFRLTGLTAGDLIEAISANYGVASKPTDPPNIAPAPYGEQQEVLAAWQDANYRFDLIRGSYGPTYRLVGVLKRLETPFLVSTAEALRLDQKEAPQREAERIAKEGEAARSALDQDRLANKPNFRP